ncbi:MAG: rod shape-determining protein MreC, partial [Myxococcota bacterium]
SSGLGGIYPKGMRIGKVVALPEPGPQLLARATLEPTVDFSKLEQVFVILRRGATLDLLYASDDGDRPDVEP